MKFNLRCELLEVRENPALPIMLDPITSQPVLLTPQGQVPIEPAPSPLNPPPTNPGGLPAHFVELIKSVIL